MFASIYPIRVCMVYRTQLSVPLTQLRTNISQQHEAPRYLNHLPIDIPANIAVPIKHDMFSLTSSPIQTLLKILWIGVYYITHKFRHTHNPHHHLANQAISIQINWLSSTQCGHAGHRWIAPFKLIVCLHAFSVVDVVVSASNASTINQRSNWAGIS